jgi:hypothetical protein
LDELDWLNKVYQEPKFVFEMLSWEAICRFYNIFIAFDKSADNTSTLSLNSKQNQFFFHQRFFLDWETFRAVPSWENYEKKESSAFGSYNYTFSKQNSYPNYCYLLVDTLGTSFAFFPDIDYENNWLIYGYYENGNRPTIDYSKF